MSDILIHTEAGVMTITFNRARAQELDHLGDVRARWPMRIAQAPRTTPRCASC